MRTTGEPEKGGKVRSQCVTFHLFSTNDHHTKEVTDNDHHTSPSDNSITIQSQTTPTTANVTTPKVYKRTRRPPKPLKRRRPPRRNMGTNAHERHQPPTIKTHERRRAPQTPTTTSPPPCSIDNGHHYPQARRIAHPHQLPNPQATTERPTTHNPGPQTSDEERPPQPPMNNEGRPQTRTMATTLDRQPPARSIDNSHHRSQATNAAHQQRQMTWMDDIAMTDNDNKRR